LTKDLATTPFEHKSQTYYGYEWQDDGDVYTTTLQFTI